MASFKAGFSAFKNIALTPMRVLGAPQATIGASATNQTLQAGLIRSGGLMLGGLMANKAMNTMLKRNLPKVPQNAQIFSGKRGIDANNMNASGVGLAMHRKRRSF